MKEFFIWVDLNPLATAVLCLLILIFANIAKRIFFPWFIQKQINYYQRKADKKGFGVEFCEQLALHNIDGNELPRLFYRAEMLYRSIHSVK